MANLLVRKEQKEKAKSNVVRAFSLKGRKDDELLRNLYVVKELYRMPTTCKEIESFKEWYLSSDLSHTDVRDALISQKYLREDKEATKKKLKEAYIELVKANTNDIQWALLEQSKLISSVALDVATSYIYASSREKVKTDEDCALYINSFTEEETNTFKEQLDTFFELVELPLSHKHGKNKSNVLLAYGVNNGRFNKAYGLLVVNALINRLEGYCSKEEIKVVKEKAISSWIVPIMNAHNENLWDTYKERIQPFILRKYLEEIE